jgi:exonuclease III
MADTLKIRSLNANGLQCKTKRDLVFNELTKYNQEVLLLQETHTNVSDEKHYKIKWGKNVFFSHGTTNSRGVCIIIPKTFNGECEKIYADLEGRLLIVKITIEKVDYIICNIYAPVSSYEKEQIDLLMLVEKELEEYINSNLIIGGDWNVYMNDNLDKKSRTNAACTNKKYREALKTFLEEYSMADCWRLAHPNLRKYTCRSGKRGDRVTLTRIDMILIKENLLNVMEKPMIKAGFKSDNNFITLTISVNYEARGPGTWKFNNMLLRDKIYVNMIKEMIAKEIKDNNKYADKGFLWDYLKMRVRSETMIYCGKLQKEKRLNMKSLTDELEKLDQQYMDHPSDNTYQQLDTAKRELEAINKEKLLSSVFRSKCEWTEHGERNSKYFLNLEKQNFTNKHITSLNVDKKNITKGPEILKEIHTYYKKLYDHNRIDEVKLEEVLKDVPKLSEVQKNRTKGLITYNECLKALKSLSNGKTPGLDGITTDFYKFFWNDISPTVLDSLNHAFEKNEMSADQRSGLITLTPKKKS